MGYTSCGDPGEHEIKGPPGRCFAVELFEFQFMYEGDAVNFLSFISFDSLGRFRDVHYFITFVLRSGEKTDGGPPPLG